MSRLRSCVTRPVDVSKGAATRIFAVSPGLYSSLSATSWMTSSLPTRHVAYSPPDAQMYVADLIALPRLSFEDARTRYSPLALGVNENEPFPSAPVDALSVSTSLS